MSGNNLTYHEKLAMGLWRSYKAMINKNEDAANDMKNLIPIGNELTGLTYNDIVKLPDEELLNISDKYKEIREKYTPTKSKIKRELTKIVIGGVEHNLNKSQLKALDKQYDDQAKELDELDKEDNKLMTQYEDDWDYLSDDLKESLVNFGCFDQYGNLLESFSLVESIDFRETDSKVKYLSSIDVNFEDIDYLGSGDFGTAYSIGDGKVLKITSSKTEFAIAQELMKNNYSSFAKVYDTQLIDGDMIIVLEELDVYGDVEDLWYQMSEILDSQGLPAVYVGNLDLDEWREQGNEVSDELESFISDVYGMSVDYRNLGIEAADLRPENIGMASDGTYKAFDIEDKSGRYTSMVESIDMKNTQLYNGSVDVQSTKWYHHSNIPNIKELKASVEGYLGKGIYLTNSEFEHQHGKYTYEVTVNVTNPIIYDENNMNASIEKYDNILKSTPSDGVVDFSKHRVKSFTNDRLETSIGFDAKIRILITDGEIHLCVFNPANCKINKKHNNSINESVDVDKFKQWFGNSVVINEDGTPKKMFHGTPSSGFDEFKPDNAGLIYFTDSADLSNVYTSSTASASQVRPDESKDPGIYSVYLRMQNPFDTRKEEHEDLFYNEFYRKWGNGTKLNSETNLPDWTDSDDLKEFFEENDYGFDGMILNENDVHITYVVFSPNQVKSVYNKGEWSNESNKLTESTKYVINNASVDNLVNINESLDTIVNYPHKREDMLDVSEYLMNTLYIESHDFDPNDMNFIADVVDINTISEMPLLVRAFNNPDDMARVNKISKSLNPNYPIYLHNGEIIAGVHRSIAYYLNERITDVIAYHVEYDSYDDMNESTKFIIGDNTSNLIESACDALDLVTSGESVYKVTLVNDKIHDTKLVFKN